MNTARSSPTENTKTFNRDTYILSPIAKFIWTIPLNWYAKAAKEIWLDRHYGLEFINTHHGGNDTKAAVMWFQAHLSSTQVTGMKRVHVQGGDQVYPTAPGWSTGEGTQGTVYEFTPLLWGRRRWKAPEPCGQSMVTLHKSLNVCTARIPTQAFDAHPRRRSAQVPGKVMMTRAASWVKSISRCGSRWWSTRTIDSSTPLDHAAYEKNVSALIPDL